MTIREMSELAAMGIAEVSDAWAVLESHGFPPEAVGWPKRSISGLLPEAIEAAISALVRQREDILAEVIRLREAVTQPQRATQPDKFSAEASADLPATSEIMDVTARRDGTHIQPQEAQDPQGAFLLCAEAARSMRMAAAHANVFGRLSEAYGAVEVEIKSLAKQAKEGKPIQDNTGHEWSFSRPECGDDAT